MVAAHEKLIAALEFYAEGDHGGRAREALTQWYLATGVIAEEGDE
jgi:hypothetical protein